MLCKLFLGTEFWMTLNVCFKKLMTFSASSLNNNYYPEDITEGKKKLLNTNINF